MFPRPPAGGHFSWLGAGHPAGQPDCTGANRAPQVQGLGVRVVLARAWAQSRGAVRQDGLARSQGPRLAERAFLAEGAHL